MNNSAREDELFTNAFLYAPIGKALIGLEGRCIRVNPAMCRLLGYEHDELLACSFQQLTYEPDVEADLTQAAQLLAGEIATYSLEKRFVHKNGSLVWVLLSVSLAHDEAGRPEFFISQIVDLTETKKSKTLVEELSLKIVGLLDNMQDAFISLDAQWRFLMINKSAEKLFERERDPLLGRSIWEELPELADTELELNFRIAHATQTAVEAEIHTKETDKWHAISVYPTVEGLAIYFRDVTARKRSELQLIESEQRFRLLTEHSSDLISRQTTDGIYTYVSPISTTLTGYAPEELVGTNAYDLIDLTFLQQTVENHFKVLQGPGISMATYKIRRKDGSYIWFETTSRLVVDGDGHGKEIMSVSRDVSERMEAELKLREANELLERLSTIDGLTGISNRRTFDRKLQEYWRAATRSGKPFSLILCDIDQFKRYNDAYGHLDGDECLRRVGEAISGSLYRPLDLASRYGGEEFAVLLPDTNAAAARQIGERMRKAVEALNIPHRTSNVTDRISISLGAGTITPSPELSPGNLVSRADTALHRAKREGRNCVVGFEE